jgi:hypothetical protein
MTMRQTTLSLPDGARATLTLPDPPSADAIAHLEDAIGSLLRRLRRELGNEAGDDPGAVEFESWLRQLRRA